MAKRLPTTNPNIHFCEEQLDNIGRNVLPSARHDVGFGAPKMVELNWDVLKQLITQAREALLVPHLEYQIDEQIRDKMRILDEFQAKVKGLRAQVTHEQQVRKIG